MGNMSRNKGLAGEREVAARFREAGYVVKALEAGGDWLCVSTCKFRPPLHVEVKRAEQLRLKEWLAQSAAEAQPGAVPLVVYRQSAQPWRVVLSLDAFLALLR